MATWHPILNIREVPIVVYSITIALRA